MNKKIGGVILSIFLLSVLMISFVFAQQAQAAPKTFQQTVDDILRNYVNPVTKFIIGDVTQISGQGSTGELLLIKALFFIIILALVYYGVKAIPTIGDNRFLLWIIPLIISIIAIRYISAAEVIEFIWLPTGVFGVVVATIIPFIIFLFFIEKVVNNDVVRKVGWVTFAVVYFMLALLRWNNLKIAGAATPIPWITNLAWFYVAIAVLSVIVMLLDKRVRAMMINAKSVQLKKEQISVRISKLTDDYNEATAAANNTDLPEAQQKAAKKRADRIQKKIDELNEIFAS